MEGHPECQDSMAKMAGSPRRIKGMFMVSPRDRSGTLGRRGLRQGFQRQNFFYSKVINVKMKFKVGDLVYDTRLNLIGMVMKVMV